MVSIITGKYSLYKSLIWTTQRWNQRSTTSEPITLTITPPMRFTVMWFQCEIISSVDGGNWSSHRTAASHCETSLDIDKVPRWDEHFVIQQRL